MDEHNRIPKEEDDPVDQPTGDVLGADRAADLDDSHHAGSRDVTEGTTGGTGPDTGGAGRGARELTRGSGATGTDIGR